MKWNLLSDKIPNTLNELNNVVLANRSVTDSKSFFSPAKPDQLEASKVGIDDTHLAKALDKIWQAKENQESIIIFGDYDADGISATAVLWQTLQAFGCRVMPFIPDRQKHGYGLSKAGIDDILQHGKPDVIITVDNGIVAFEALAYAEEAGIEVIVTDHHLPEKASDGQPKLPPAVAVVHTTQLCGTTVAWMLSHAVASKSLSEKTPEATKVAKVVHEALDLCAIATIADQVPLTNANRSFAFHGLAQLRVSKRPGILALMETSTTAQADIDTYTINFVLAPRINAMGRLAHGLDALRLLCTNSIDKARELAVILNQTNADRQELTADLLELAILQAENRVAAVAKAGQAELNIIVVASQAFHEGVVGLVAGKLVEVFGRPAIAISLGDSIGKASARSVPGVNVIELVRQVKDDLLEAGGHPMAAGFGLEVSKLETVKLRLEELAAKQINSDQLEPGLDIECSLPYELVTKQTAEHLTKFAPFGKANPEPVFLFSEYYVFDVQVMGKENRHLRFKIQPVNQAAAQPLSCVAWGMGERLAELQQYSLENKAVNLVGKVTINGWNGKSYLQVVVEGVTSQS